MTTTARYIRILLFQLAEIGARDSQGPPLSTNGRDPGSIQIQTSRSTFRPDTDNFGHRSLPESSPFQLHIDMRSARRPFSRGHSATPNHFNNVSGRFRSYPDCTRLAWYCLSHSVTTVHPTSVNKNDCKMSHVGCRRSATTHVPNYPHCSALRSHSELLTATRDSFDARWWATR